MRSSLYKTIFEYKTIIHTFNKKIKKEKMADSKQIKKTETRIWDFTETLIRPGFSKIQFRLL